MTIRTERSRAMRSSSLRLWLWLTFAPTILASLGGTSRPAGAEATFELVKSFAEAEQPVAPMVVGSDGSLYGTTSEGGLYGRGTVFKMTSAGAYTSLHSFSGPDGENPRAA